MNAKLAKANSEFHKLRDRTGLPSLAERLTFEYRRGDSHPAKWPMTWESVHVYSTWQVIQLVRQTRLVQRTVSLPTSNISSVRVGESESFTRCPLQLFANRSVYVAQ